MYLVATGQYTNVIVTSERQCFAVLGMFLMVCQALHYLVEPAKTEGEPKKEKMRRKHAAKCLKNIINNTVLYTVILYLLLSEDHSSLIPSHSLLHVLELFVWGRIIFAVGYFLGTLIEVQSLRSYGFGLCIGSLAVLISSHFHSDFLAHFK